MKIFYCLLASSIFYGHAVNAASLDAAGVNFAMSPTEAEAALKEKFGIFERVQAVDEFNRPTGYIYYFPKKVEKVDPKNRVNDLRPAMFNPKPAWNQRVELAVASGKVVTVIYQQNVYPCPGKQEDVLGPLTKKYGAVSEGKIENYGFQVSWHYNRAGNVVNYPGKLECDSCGNKVIPTTGKWSESKFLCASPFTNQLYTDKMDCGSAVAARLTEEQQWSQGAAIKACVITIQADNMAFQLDKAAKEAAKEKEAAKAREAAQPKNKVQF